MSDHNARPTGLGALAQRVIICAAKIKAAEDTLADLKADLDIAKEAMLAGFAANGLTSIKYRGYTVYLQDQLFASLVSAEPQDDEDPKTQAMKALKNNELGWMVKETVPAQTLSAWVREQEVDEKTHMPKLPEPLAPWVKVSKKTDVRLKRA